MKDLHQLFIRRRSVRKYADEAISPENVALLLEAALLAPSGKNRKPCHFIAIDDKETLAALSQVKAHGASFVKEANLCIVIAADTLASDTWIEDSAIAATFIQLQCEDLGLGSCWIQVRDRYTEQGYASEDFVRGQLDLPLHYGVLAILAIGHKGETKQEADCSKLEWERVHVSKFINNEI